jgi:NitT/TauT family transport system substrate-binding protein
MNIDKAGTPNSLSKERRHFLKAAACTVAGGALVTFRTASASNLTDVRIQYDWLIGNGQLGDIVAQKKGFFSEQGLNVTFGPGGPNAQTVSPVLSGQSQLGQLSGTSLVFMAASADRPITVIASGWRYSPYAYISLPKNPIRTPADMVGKTIAINPNGRLTLDIMLSKNKIDRSKVRTVTMGADLTPLLSGQVDAVSGFMTNTTQLSVLGPDIIAMLPAKNGVPNYANPYFVATETLSKDKEQLSKFIRAVSKGWAWAFANRHAAVDLMCDAYPSLNRQIEHRTVDMIMELSFDDVTRKQGWGWHTRENLAAQIRLLDQAGIFKAGKVPVIDDCVTWDILNATADARPKLG